MEGLGGMGVIPDDPLQSSDIATKNHLDMIGEVATSPVRAGMLSTINVLTSNVQGIGTPKYKGHGWHTLLVMMLMWYSC